VNKRSLWTKLVLSVAIASTACQDNPSAPADPAPSPVSASADLTGARPLDEVALRLAVTLGSSEGARQSLYSALKGSGFKERKLSVGRHVLGDRAFGLKARLSADGSLDSITELLNRLSEVEIYFPVDGQLDAWHGSENLIVVAAFEEDHPIMAYDLAGKEILLSADVAPTTPTLVMTRSETDFRVEPRTEGDFATQVQHLIDCEGEEDCGGGGAGGGGGMCGSTPDNVDGAYMRCMYLSDLHEPWYRGDPEIEVHTVNNNSFVYCAGDGSVSEFRRFDMNSNNWSGEVLLRPETLSGTNHHFVVLEDDNGGGCTNTSSNQRLDNSNANLLASATAVKTAIKKDTATGQYSVSWWAVAVAAFTIWNGLDDDDVIGRFQELTGNPTYNTQVINDSGAVVGRAQVVHKNDN